MKTLQRIFPIIAVIAVLGGAIFYVRSTAPQRPEPVQQVTSAPAAQNVLPPGDRYKDSSAGS